MTPPISENRPDARPRRPFVRRDLWRAAALACLVLTPVYLVVAPRLRLEVYLRQLSHQGEKLTVAELTEPPRAAGVVAADRFLRLAQQLPPAPPAERFGPPAGMTYVAPGIAQAGWQQSYVPVRFQGNPPAGSGR